MALIDLTDGTLAFALYRQSSTRIEPLVGFVDGWLSEEHEMQVSTTTYPVESGASLTDHAMRRPDTLKLEGWVSDLVPSDEADRGLPLELRAGAAWAEISRLMNDSELLRVATPLRTYRDMLITKASAPVSRGTGRGLRFTLELNQILLRPLRELAGGLRLVLPDAPTNDRVTDVQRGRVIASSIESAEGEGSIYPTEATRFNEDNQNEGLLTRIRRFIFGR